MGMCYIKEVFFFRTRPQKNSLGLDVALCKECINREVKRTVALVATLAQDEDIGPVRSIATTYWCGKLGMNVGSSCAWLQVNTLIKSSGSMTKNKMKRMTTEFFKLFKGSLQFTTNLTRRAGETPRRSGERHHEETQLTAKAKLKQKPRPQWPTESDRGLDIDI